MVVRYGWMILNQSLFIYSPIISSLQYHDSYHIRGSVTICIMICILLWDKCTIAAVLLTFVRSINLTKHWWLWITDVYSLQENFLNLLARRTSDCLNLLAPNDFYRPPKVYHKKFDQNEKPVGLLDFQFSLNRPQIHWPRSSDHWVFVKTVCIYNPLYNSCSLKSLSIQGPLLMHPPAEDNYGVDACSIAVLGTSPMVVVIATRDGKLHHCVVLDSNTEDSTLQVFIFAKCLKFLQLLYYFSTLRSLTINFYVR
jgi:hypothetical protein